ncbi:MAG TPA: vWA domain-containing protein [Polyangiaceae bacterium]|nr:vWA domain-containing protein [Polyangiaceae bacterium]
MKFEFVSTVCLSIGVASAYFGACGGSEESTFGSTGTNASGGTPSSGSGVTTASSGSGVTTLSSGAGNPGGTGSGSGGSGSSGGSGIFGDAACAAQAQDSTAIPVDIFIMLDKSGSMQCDATDDGCSSVPDNTPVPPNNRWVAVSAAINAFVSSPTSAGIGVGIGFFGQGSGRGISCNAADYARPAVAIAPLPGNAKAISDAIAGQMPAGGTPTVPALTGAITYARTYTATTTGRSAAVVLVTDGIPQGCQGNNIPAASALATAAFLGMPAPQIKTYVVGLGATQSLNEIALAGSGNATPYFPATGNVAAQLTAALKQISGAITCDYTIPKNGGKALDFGQVNVEVKVGANGMTQFVGKVADLAACGAPGGWFYDNNTAPSKITLCPASCDPLKAAEGSSLKVLIGCATQPGPIN